MHSAHRVLQRVRNSADVFCGLLFVQVIVDAALTTCEAAGHNVSKVLVYDHTLAVPRSAVAMREGRDVWWQDVVESHSTTCDVEWVDAEDPLFKVAPPPPPTPHTLSHTPPPDPPQCPFLFPRYRGWFGLPLFLLCLNNNLSDLRLPSHGVC